MNAPAEDAAWVTIETRADLYEAQRFFTNIERVFRANPYLEIKSWHTRDNDSFDVELRNLSNGIEQKFELSVSRPRQTEVFVHYSAGLKRCTHFELSAVNGGSRVRITDDYSALSIADRVVRLAEVDHSLTAWGHALSAYLRRERYIGGLRSWYWFLDRVWLPMKPSARRICIVIAWITFAEFVLAVLIAAIYWLEAAHSS